MRLQLARQGIRQHGLAGSLMRATRIAAQRFGRLPYLREQHLWWLLDLAAERPRLHLPKGMQCRRLDASETQNAATVTEVGFVESRRRLANGAELWAVTDDGRVVSSCWVFRHRVPALASSSGWLELPADTACMQDSFTIPSYRGRGIAAAGWSQVGDALAASGVRAVIGKVEIADTASRRSLVKAGFMPIAYMELTRLWMQPRVMIEPFSDEWPVRWLVGQLST